MELTDAQWELLKPLVEPRTPQKRRGRPWRDTRQVLEGVLWILRTGAQWSELPRDKFPPYQTCHRRFQQWVRMGTLVKLLRRLAEDLLARGQLDLAETFIDASFSGAKKGAVQLVQHAAAKGPRSWQSRTAMVFLSPWGLQALRLMKPSWSRPRSSSGSLEKGRSA
jgi:transposase